MLLDVCRVFCIKPYTQHLDEIVQVFERMTPLDLLVRVVSIIGSDKGDSLVDAYTLGADRVDASEFISELLENFGTSRIGRVELIIDQTETDKVSLLDYALCVLDGEVKDVSGSIVIPTDYVLLGVAIDCSSDYNVESM